MSGPIRALASADALAISSLMARCPGAPRWSLDQIRSERGYGAFDESGLHLRAFLLCRDSGAGSDAVCEIVYLATDPLSRRQGGMQRLFQSVLRGRTGEIWLEVHRDNAAARALYEKLGFGQVGERPRYYADGGDAVLYSLRLAL